MAVGNGYWQQNLEGFDLGVDTVAHLRNNSLYISFVL